MKITSFRLIVLALIAALILPLMSLPVAGDYELPFVPSNGETETETETEHDWDEGVVTKAPTCTSPGVRTYTCRHNSSHTYTEEIPALGHAWDEGTVIFEPTCTEPGLIEYTCLNKVMHTYEDEIPALGHAWGEWELTKAPTLTEDGEETRVCANNPNHVETRTVSKIEVVDLAVTVLPARLEYFTGDEFDPTGIEITAAYSDGRFENVTGYTLSGFDSSTPGEKRIRVDYFGASTDFAVNVKLPPILVVDSAVCHTGATAVISVRVENNPGFTLMAITPDYGEIAALEPYVEGVASKTDIEGASLNYVIESKLAGGANFAEDGVIFTIEIDVPDGFEAGDYELGFIFRDCVNQNSDGVAFRTVNGTLTVLDYVYGDANGDRAVDLADANLLKQYVANYNFDTGEAGIEVAPGADANADGEINLADANLLKQYVANFNFDTGLSGVTLGPN